MFRKILICSDGSAHAQRAASAAAELSAKLSAELTVVHVFQQPVVPLMGDGYLGLDPSLFVPPTTEMQDRIAEPVFSVLREAGAPFADERRIGHPAEEITRFAKDGGFDLIVIGSRGHGAFASLILGSVSDHVVHHAPCAVLVIR